MLRFMVDHKILHYVHDNHILLHEKVSKRRTYLTLYLALEAMITNMMKGLTNLYDTRSQWTWTMEFTNHLALICSHIRLSWCSQN